MTTYYVSADNGDDADDGLTVANAIQSVSHLETLMGSGDIAYFEAGVYGIVEVALDTDGADANHRIQMIGDIKGDHFSTKGGVMFAPDAVIGIGHLPVSDNDDYMFRITGDYWRFENINFAVGTDLTSNCIFLDHSYGHYFYRCRFHMASRENAVWMDFSSYTGDVEDYTIFDSCVKYARGFWIGRPRDNTLYDCKVVIVNCLDFGIISVGYARGLWGTTESGAGTYVMGGVRIYHNTVVGDDFHDALDSEGDGCEYYNNMSIACGDESVNHPSVAAAKGNCRVLGGMGSNTWAGEVSMFENHGTAGGFGLVGGITDLDYYRKFGVSPYQPWELYSNDYVEMWPISAGFDIPYGNPERDIYGVRRGNSPPTWLYAEIGGSGGTDPDGAWLVESNAFNFAYTASNDPTGGLSNNNIGSVSSKYLEATGVPSLMADQGIIREVKVLLIATNAGNPPASSRDMGYRVTTAAAAETLATGTVTLDVGADKLWDLHEVDLTAPAAGWNWTNLAALEGRVWVAEDTGGSPSIEFHAMLLRYQVSGGNTPGAVQSYQRPSRDAGELYDGEATSVLTGAGMQQILLPCPTAGSYTITIPYKYDANYTGTLPTVDVIGIVGQADQTAVATGASGSWNTDLTIEVAPTEAGFVCVRIYSLDTSGTAECWFGGVSIAESDAPVGVYMHTGGEILWDTFATIDDIGSGPDFTIEAWVKVNTHPGGSGPSSNIMLMHKRTISDSFASGWGIGCEQSGGKLWCWFNYTYDPATEIDIAYTETQAASNFEIGDWVYLTVVNDDSGDGDLLFYVNGVPGTYTTPGVTYVGPEIADLTIGGAGVLTDYSASDIEIMGLQISDYAKYDGAFTPPARQSIPQSDTGHLLMVPFNEGTGTDVYDIDDATKGTMTASGGTIDWGAKP